MHVSLADGRALTWYRGLCQERVAFHPASALARVGDFRFPYCVFYERTAQGAAGRPSIRDASAVAPLALLLFSGARVTAARGRILLGDGFVAFRGDERTASIVCSLRHALAEELAHKLATPSFDLAGSPVVACAQKVLSAE